VRKAWPPNAEPSSRSTKIERGGVRERAALIEVGPELVKQRQVAALQEWVDQG
jgi:hypothetical protein